VSDAPSARGAHLTEGLAAAREAFLGWVDQAGEVGRVFLEAHVCSRLGGAYRLRHAEDRGEPEHALVRYTDPFAARGIAQTDAEGGHRPLKTAPSMRRGWTFESLDGPGLWTALDYLYPACAAHWHAGRVDSLRVTHWLETAGRQSGMYSAVGLLPERAVRDTVRACCGDAVCLRRVAWGLDPDRPEPFATDLEPLLAIEAPPAGEAVVPCPEACSMFVSLARKILSVERGRDEDVPGLGTVKVEEIAQLRQVVSAAASGSLYDVREGEFDEPANLRRVRYLAAKLASST
jgi:hypothetical protein